MNCINIFICQKLFIVVINFYFPITFQAAIKLEPANAVFRTMLAELYFELKFHRRAQTELDRALSIDPHNGAANLLLRKLAKSRKVG